MCTFKKRILLIFLALTGFLFKAHPVFSVPISLAGYVLDPDSRPVEGAKVVFTAGGSLLDDGVSDEHGYFCVTASGTFSGGEDCDLGASHPEYFADSISIDTGHRNRIAINHHGCTIIRV